MDGSDYSGHMKDYPEMGRMMGQQDMMGLSMGQLMGQRDMVGQRDAKA